MEKNITTETKISFWSGIKYAIGLLLLLLVALFIARQTASDSYRVALIVSIIELDLFLVFVFFALFCWNTINKRKRKDAIEKFEREIAVEKLSEHLKQIGLRAAVLSTKCRSFGRENFILGSVRVENRNIDLVELEWWRREWSTDYGGGYDNFYRCNYVVQANVDEREGKLKAEYEPVRKSFLGRGVVGFKWEGGEVAQFLDSDANATLLPYVEIKHYKNDSCIRISQKWSGDNSPSFRSPVSAFPSIEIFEIFDRIAQHVRSVTNGRP